MLNEYLDGSMLYNSVPYKAGQLLGIPFTNTVLPVMIQYPKSKNMNAQLLQAIRDDFNNLDRLVQDPSFPNNEYLDYFDDVNQPSQKHLHKQTGRWQIPHGHHLGF